MVFYSQKYVSQPTILVKINFHSLIYHCDRIVVYCNSLKKSRKHSFVEKIERKVPMDEFLQYLKNNKKIKKKIRI